MPPIVVDLGCQDYGTQDSLTALAAEYHPSLMYGFDPSDLLNEKVTRINGTRVVLKRRAAWLYDGQVAGDNRTTTFAVGGGGDQLVDCFDFSKWLGRRHQPVILKMDIEGAEYALLERILADGTDNKIAELVVEWHSGDPGLGLSCPVREWWM